jgi:ATP-binding cassette, subfamily C (CFTR/MRP), member 1
LTPIDVTIAIADLILTCIATGYLILAVPVFAVALYTLQRVYLQTSRQVKLLDLEAKSPLFSHFISSFSGLVTIRAFNWSKRAHDQNIQRLDSSQKVFYLEYCLIRWLALVINLIIASLGVLLAIFSVAYRDTIDPALLGVGLVSIMGFGQLLGFLLHHWTQLETSLGAVARIREFESDTPREKDGTVPVPDEWPPRGGISIQNVSASYDDHQVLNEINLDIKPGEKVAICGRTGSGKSTLVSLLLRLHKIDTGKIIIDGADITSVPLNNLRTSLVALPQDPLFLVGSVRLNLDPFSKSDDSSIWVALEKIGLESVIKSHGGLDVELNTDWLSSGQKQLFCMARALLRNSHVLILDEATSG